MQVTVGGLSRSLATSVAVAACFAICGAVTSYRLWRQLRKQKQVLAATMLGADFASGGGPEAPVPTAMELDTHGHGREGDRGAMLADQ